MDRQPFAAPGQDPAGFEAIVAGDQVGDRHLTEDVVGLAGGRGVRHPRHRPDRLVDLAGVDVDRAPDDEFLDPAGDAEEALVVAAGQVTAAVPAVAEPAVGLGPGVVVPEHQARPLDPDLTFLAGADDPAVGGVHQTHVEAGDRPAAGAGRRGLVEAGHGDRPARLGAAVGVEHDDAERLLDLRAQGVGGDRTGDERKPQARDPTGLCPGLGDQQVIHGWDAGQDAERLPAQGVEHLVGGESAHDVRGGADDAHAEQAQAVGQAVVQGQRPQDAVPLLKPGHRQVAGDDRPQAAALGAQDALGPAGGARGVEHPGRVVESEAVPGGDARVRTGQVREGRGPRRAPHHDDLADVAAVRRLAHLVGVGGPGDDGHRAAVGEEVAQLVLRAVR